MAADGLSMARYILEITQPDGEIETEIYRNKDQVISRLLIFIGDISLRRTE